MRKLLSLALAAGVSAVFPAAAADPPVKLVVRPLLCVLEQTATGCMMKFDIRWQSLLAQELCLNDSVQPAPLLCWPSASVGETRQERLVSEDFDYWLAAPSGTQRVAEVKIEVLRVGSADRRRERRTRHVWDVL